MAIPTASVAIITRTKNRPITLKRAVESVLNQGYTDFIHVIVNDGGDKGEVDALLAKSHDRYNGRLLVIHHDVSKGMEAASNAGIIACDSKYLIIHDDDDSWHPEFLTKTVEFLESQVEGSNIAGVLTDFERIVETPKNGDMVEIGRESCRGWIQELTLWNMCKGNFFPPIAFLYKREVYDVIGGLYDESLPVLGDWEFNLRFLQHFDIGYLEEPLAGYHHRAEQNAHCSYGNTVIAGVNKHNYYNRVLRNRFLREDIKKQTFGVGYLMNYLYEEQKKKNDALKENEGWLFARCKKLIVKYRVTAVPARLAKRTLIALMQYIRGKRYGRA